MDRIFDGKFHYNASQYSFERADREQTYEGVKIVSITSYLDGRPRDRKRFYEVTWPDGHVSIHGINKRGDNIASLKRYIDFKKKYNEI